MAERYCVPTSAPCRFNVVGSWTVKYTSRISLKETALGSKVTWITSAWPVLPLQTCSYVGLGSWPPEYPETTSSTPCRLSNTGSTHQKQPPPRVATSLIDSPTGGLPCT